MIPTAAGRTATAQPGQTVHSGDGRITVYRTPCHVTIGWDRFITYPLTPCCQAMGDRSRDSVTGTVCRGCGTAVACRYAERCDPLVEYADVHVDAARWIRDETREAGNPCPNPLKCAQVAIHHRLAIDT